MSLLKFKPEEARASQPTPVKELEIVEMSEAVTTALVDDGEADAPRERKSARARFGTNRIGSVSLPIELQNAIERVIDGM